MVHGAGAFAGMSDLITYTCFMLYVAPGCIADGCRLQMVALAHGCRLMSRMPGGQVAQGCIHRVAGLMVLWVVPPWGQVVL